MIVFPMMGKGKRFQEAGYKLPKFMLSIEGVSTFSYSVSSFNRYFKSEQFMFICPKETSIAEFVKSEVENLGISKFNIVELGKNTSGQGETVFLGLTSFLKKSGIWSDFSQELIIFNIDTRTELFKKPNLTAGFSGYLEVFEALGDHWSFVSPLEGEKVRCVEEKKRISDLCSTGLYHFHTCDLFISYFHRFHKDLVSRNGESYVAPIYNYMIQDGLQFEYVKSTPDRIKNFGTPEDYETHSKNKKKYT